MTTRTIDCTCLSLLRGMITERTGDPSPEGPLEKSLMLTQPGNQLAPVFTLSILARKRKKNGELSASRSHTKIVCNYCPLCGEKLGQVLEDAGNESKTLSEVERG